MRKWCNILGEIMEKIKNSKTVRDRRHLTTLQIFANLLYVKSNNCFKIVLQLWNKHCTIARKTNYHVFTMQSDRSTNYTFKIRFEFTAQS